MKKHPLKSGVLWFNVLSGVLLVTQALTDAHLVPGSVAAVGIAVVNAIARIFTTKSIGLKP